MHQRLVRVHHLLQVDGLVAVVGEGGITVEVLVGLHDVLDGRRRLYHCRAEDATGKVAAIGDKINVGIQVTLHLLQTLSYLGDVLMLERLVDAQVVGAPGEMRGGSRLLAGTRRSRDGVDADIVLQQVQIGGRQQRQLYGGGEAAGVGHMLCLHDVGFVDFRQAIDPPPTNSPEGENRSLPSGRFGGGQPKVLRQVDDLHMLRNGVLLKEGLALPVAEAEEHHVDLVERHLIRKAQLRIANQSFVHVAHQVPCVALAVGKDNLCLGMVEQQADELTARIACSAKDPHLYSSPRGGCF